MFKNEGNELSLRAVENENESHVRQHYRKRGYKTTAYVVFVFAIN